MNESIKVIAEFVDNASDGLQAATNMVKEFYAGIIEGAKAELDAIAANNKYNDSLDKTTPVAESAVTSLAKLAVQIYAAKQVMDQFVQSIVQADKLDDLSDKTGIAAADLKELEFAAKMTGTSLDGLVTAFTKLGRSATMSEEEVKKQAATFEQLGVSATDANGNVKDSETLFLELADAFKGLEDSPEKSAAAFRLFGSEAKNLMPLLNQGADGIKTLREESTQLGGMSKDSFNAFAKASGDLFDKLDKLSLVFTGMFNTMNAELVPVLNVFLDQIIASAKEGGLLRDVINAIEYAFREGVIPVLKIGAIALDGFTSVVKIAAKGLGALGAAFVAILSGDFAGARDIMSQYGDDVAKVAQEHVEFQQKLALAGHEAVKLADSTEKPKTRLRALGKAAKDTKEAVGELQGMLDSLSNTNKAFGQDESAKQTLEAQAKYFKDVKTIGPDAAKALYDQVIAQIDLNRALRQGKDAQDAFVKAQAGVDAIKASNDEMAFEITLIGKSSDERAKAIDLRKEEIRLQNLQKGLTKDAAQAIADEGAAALKARGDLIDARNDAKITNDIIGQSYDTILADVQHRLIIATQLLEAGKITIDDYNKYVDSQMGRFKDKTKQDLTDVQTFWAEAGKGIQQNLQTAIFDYMQGKLSNLKDAIKNTLDQIVAQILAAKLATAMFGANFAKGEIGGAVGAGIGWLSGLFSGARASGGPVQAGKMYMVGERGPEPFIPATNGTVLPNSVLSQGSNVSIAVTAIDSKDFLAKMAEVKREVVDMMNATSRNYRMKGV